MRAIAHILALLQLAALPSGCAPAAEVRDVFGPREVSIPARAYQSPPVDPDGPCVQSVRSGRHHVWVRNHAPVNGPLWRALADDPEAARIARRAAREYAALPWVGLGAMPALYAVGAGLLFPGLAHGPVSHVEAGGALVGAAVGAWFTLLALGFSGKRDERRAADAYNDWARVHGCK